jgi:hypothetical protein
MNQRQAGFSEGAPARSQAAAAVARAAALEEALRTHGQFEVECRDAQGALKWRDTVHNTVTTEGKNFMLDTLLKGSSYSVAGPFMGLISSVSYTTGPAVGDTAAQINGTNAWKEAGVANAPTFAARGTAAFNVASGGIEATSAAVSFTMTGAGTLKGCFLVLGTGAVSTIASTAGKLLSAGLFTGGDKTVASTDVVNVTYQLQIT